jgi:uncharacterized membrane protein SpoIIM required for sporulation
MSKKIIIIFRKEILDLIRDWRLSLPAVGFAISIPTLVLIGLISLSKIFTIDLNYTLENFYLSSVLIICFFPSSLTVVIALENFVGEKERQTLETLLLAPLSSGEIYWGKFFSSIIPPLFLGILSFFIYFLESIIFLKYAIFSLSLLTLIFLLVIGKSLVLISGAIVISSHSKNIRSANLVSTLIVLPVTLLVILEVHLFVKKIYTPLYFLFLILFIYFLIFVYIGIRSFDRENLLSVDSELKTIFLLFKNLLIKIKELKLEKIPVLLKDSILLISKHRIHLLIFSSIFLISVFISFIYCRYLINITGVKYFPYEKFYKLSEEFTFFYIAKHNLIALTICFFFSPLTFGATGLLFVIIPASMIGFLLGLNQPIDFKIILNNLYFLLPHGIFEIPAAIISGFFIFKLGTQLMRTKKNEDFFSVLFEFFKILIIVIPLFILAAYIEGNF